MLRLDIRELKRLWKIEPGQTYGLVWQLGEDQIGFGARATPNELELIDRCNYTKTHLGLTKTACHYGGSRTWFFCPDCGRRCAVLFGFTSSRGFACRVCQHLAYASETEGQMDRCLRQVRKIESQFVDGYRRPKWMREKTFSRLCDRVDALDARMAELLSKRVNRSARRSKRRSATTRKALCVHG
jgi:hypothetical protein